MRIVTVVLLFIITLTVYVGWHLWRLTPMGWPMKLAVTGVFLLWMATLIVGFFTMERYPIIVSTALYEVGTTWLIVFLYLLIIFALADVAWLCHLWSEPLKDSASGLLIVVGIITGVIVLGGRHYHRKYREEITITTDKHIEQPLTVVLASDLHIGYHNRKGELARWVDLINAEQPDVVLFGGDIIDRSLRPIIEGNYAEELRRIQAPVYTVFGNHEYFSSSKQMVGGQAALSDIRRFLEDAGIVLLRDSVAHYKGLDIIGRDDRMAHHRADVKALAVGLRGFTILLDHQPYRLEEAEQAGIDFQFSGHTHRGQVWPLSCITDAMYEKSWGHHQRGSTQYYISSGLGIWGPKVRVGTRSEYVVLHVLPKP